MIYFIQAGDNGPVKIGTTERNIPQRVKELQTASPYPLKLIAILSGNTAEEMIIHNKFSHLRLNGEWFKIDKELNDFIATIPLPITDISCVPEANPDIIERKLKSASITEILEEIETMYITHALERSNGNKSKAAEILGISLRSLRYRVDVLGIETPV